MAIITKFLIGPASAPVHQVGTYLQSAENVLDFGANGFDVLSGDEVEIIKLPNEAVVTKVTMEVITAEGSVVTIDVGDSIGQTDSVAGWHAGYDGNTASAPGTSDSLQIGTGNLSPLAGALGSGRRYIGGLLQDRIVMIPNADLSTLKIWFSVEYYVREQF